MEPLTKHFLLKVDMTAVIRSPEVCIYNLLINPKEVATIYDLKLWIQYLFGVPYSLKVHCDDAILHDFESIDIIFLLKNIVRISCGGPQPNIKTFLNNTRKRGFSNIPLAMKTRLKRMVEFFELRYSDEYREDHCGQGPEQFNFQSPASTANNLKVGEPPSVEKESYIVNPAASSTLNNFESATEVSTGETSHVQMEEQSQIEDIHANDESLDDDMRSSTAGRPKRFKSFSLGQFLDNLRNSSSGAVPTQTTETPVEEGAKIPRKRTRSRRKSRKTQNNLAEIENVDLPLPRVDLPQILPKSRHIRFVEEEEGKDKNTESQSHLPEKITPSIEKEGEEKLNPSDVNPELTPVVPAELQLLFNLKNTFGSPPVFVRS